MQLAKGHGTENDFVIIADLDGAVDLSAATVRLLCDRRAGVGGDGVLRIVRTQNVPEFAEFASTAPFFMDYRNADGSIAEMCGNGARVFVRYLADHGQIGDSTVVATRGGLRRADIGPDGEISVDMGRPELVPHAATVIVGGTPVPATAVLVPNPHLVVPVSDAATLDRLDLTYTPQVSDPLPQGQNIEFVVLEGERSLRMRVHERGVGETRSCGTGICAAVVATAVAQGQARDDVSWCVDVLGGRCTVTWRSDDHVVLTGPAMIVGAIALSDAWEAAAGLSGSSGLDAKTVGR